MCLGDVAAPARDRDRGQDVQGLLHGNAYAVLRGAADRHDCVDDFPMTVTGKVRKFEMRNRRWAGDGLATAAAIQTA